MSGGNLVKTVYNTHALHSTVASNVSTAPVITKSVTANTQVTSTSPALPATQNPPLSAADTKKREIDAILKQRELLAAEVKGIALPVDVLGQIY